MTLVSNRDHNGNTEEEVHEIFFDWLDSLNEVIQPFNELPSFGYSDLVAYCGWCDEDGECYGDLMFDLWYKTVYTKRK